MIDPLFWLGLSILLVAVSLTAVLVAALPALQELARAARSAEKLFDTLRRDLPPTLDAIRLTGLEISDLTDDVSEGVKSANQVVKQVDRSVEQVRNQTKNVETSTRSVFTGVKAAWKSFTRPSSRRTERLSGYKKQAMQLRYSNGQANPEELDVTQNRLQRSPSYYADNADYEELQPKDTREFGTRNTEFGTEADNDI